MDMKKELEELKNVDSKHDMIKKINKIIKSIDKENDNNYFINYVWYDNKTKTFSNSWIEKDEVNVKKLKLFTSSHEKLIKYKCLTDKNFKFRSI